MIHVIATKFGALELEETERGVRRISFVEGGASRAVAPAKPTNLEAKLSKYFQGGRVDFSTVSLDLQEVSSFQRRVWEAAMKIPYGEVRTYGWIARKLNSSPRAVGQALKSNPLPIVIPCHRVVSSQGIGGYSGGINLKTRMLKLEGALR